VHVTKLFYFYTLDNPKQFAYKVVSVFITFPRSKDTDSINIVKLNA